MMTLRLARVGCVFLVFGIVASAQILPGFDAARSHELLSRSVKPLGCRAIPSPVVDMGGFVSRYAVNDSTQSHVDPAREAKAKPRDTALSDFATQLDHLSDRVLVSKPLDREDLKCMETVLAEWARAGAMLSNLEENNRIGKHQGIMMQAWVGGAIATSVLKVGGLPAFSSENREVIGKWFRTLGQSIIDEYQDPPNWKRPDNNHRLWAGFAVASMGAVIQESRFLDFGNKALLQGLAEVDDSGILPKEMLRGPKSLGYQDFALIAIAGLEAIMARNGRSLTPSEARKLLLLVHTTLAIIRDPQRIEKITHQAQEFKLMAASDLAWVDVLLPWIRARDEKFALELDEFMIKTNAWPTWHIWLGGDITAMYNPAAAARSGE
jgi:hypothetical protein